ncbi:PAS domain S-box protein [Azospirillum sp. SYSU D00513]|uniref:PAS domain S-box protein n=1 Tax=Azospirillum sp. SYSU D00513 TaxID=2812561 RepID=UPI001A9773A1|nr:PAS domain S-box protein [Azospirillum sp. SYSU D00513]
MTDPAFFRTLVEQHHGIVCTVDAEGRWTYLNPAWERITGYARQDSLGRPFFDFVLEEDRDACRLHLHGLMQGVKATSRHETRYRARDGRILWFQVHADRLCDEVGTPVGAYGTMTDVSERVAAEQNLRRKSELLELALESTSDALWDWSADTGELWLSPRWKEQLGYGDGELPNLLGACMDLVLEEDRTLVHDRFQAALAGASPGFEVTVRMRHRDGSIRHMRVRARVLDDGAGRARRVVGVTEDVSEQWRRQEALSEQARDLHRAHRIARIGWWRLRAGMSELEWSPESFAIAGADPGSFRPTIGWVLDRVHPEDRPLLVTALERLAADGRPQAVEYRFRDKAGRDLVIWSNAQCERNARGEVIAFFGVSQDITERREVEQSLRRKRRFIELLLKDAARGISAFDAQGRYTLWNPAMQAITGLPAGEAIGRTPAELFPDIADHRVEEARRRTLAGEAVSLREQPYEMPRTGRKGFFDAHYTPILEADGRVGGGLAIMIDVTDRVEAERRRRELEAQLAQRHRLEALGTLAGGVAHEVNNRLQPILALSELLLMNATPDTREDLDDIRRSALAARDIVRQVLAFSGGRRPGWSGSGLSGPGQNLSAPAGANLPALDLSDLVRKVLTLLRPTLPPLVRLASRLEPVPPLAGDPLQLEQMVINLITNALHALEGMPDGRVEVEVRADGGGVDLVVSDNGCGMEEGVLERVFDPFFTTKDVGKGTGLGLSVVRTIVQLHGGTIGFDTAPNRGCRAHVRFPLAAPGAGS